MTQTTPNSCVYDAFKAAGLPTDGISLDGMTLDKIKAICKRLGLPVLGKGNYPPMARCIVIEEFPDGHGHATYYESLNNIYIPRGAIIPLD